MRRAVIAAVFAFSSIAIAFQSVDTAVSITPRMRPDATSAAAPHVQAHLRVDSALVQIPVHVTTPLGTSVTDLAREHFVLFEDEVQQKIAYFAKDDAPLSIGLVLDASGSMHNKIQKACEAAATFFKTANGQDEFFLIEFNERPKLAVQFTSDSGEIYKRIVQTRPFGRTSLLDAIHAAALNMKNAQNFRKAIVILSDGGDNRSRHTAHEIKTALLEADVQVYAMGIFDPEDAKKHPLEEMNGPQLLDDLTDQTGGKLYRVDKLNDLPAISERISNELRNEYVLAYFSTNAERDGKYRRVSLKLNPPAGMPNLRAYYRHGYYAPVQ